MKEKTYFVRLKHQLGVNSITAASQEVYGDHLVFLNLEGELAALFLLDVVERWFLCDE
jgi:hypothetical protein